jgi:iron(III) transport system substrate-binding protein
MAAGEFPLGIVYAHRIESMKKAGAPVEWIKTADPIFVTLSPVAVAAKARHPNAAKLLMDFILSKEAQLVLRNANRSSGRLDVEPLVPEMHPSKLKLAAIDPSVGENCSNTARSFVRFIFAELFCLERRSCPAVMSV